MTSLSPEVTCFSLRAFTHYLLCLSCSPLCSTFMLLSPTKLFLFCETFPGFLCYREFLCINWTQKVDFTSPWLSRVPSRFGMLEGRKGSLLICLSPLLTEGHSIYVTQDRRRSRHSAMGSTWSAEPAHSGGGL